MTIELHVEPYCQDCPEFEAKTVKHLFQYYGDINARAKTIVFCEHRDRCDKMMEYLKKESGRNESAN